MGLTEYQTFTLSKFGGMNNRLDPTNVPPGEALLAQNCAFEPGSFGHRNGFAAVGSTYLGAFTAYSAVASFNWINSVGNWLASIYSGSNETNPNTIGVINLNSPLTSYGGAVDALTRGALFAPYGARLYVAAYTAAILGANQCKVLTPAVSGFNNAFMGPLTNKPTLGGSGSTAFVTAGLHRVGYIVQSVSGFTGKISPVLSATGLFDATSTVTVTAGQQIDFSLTHTWPADAALVYPVMTTVDNLERYFIIPGMAPVVVVGGVSSTVTFTITISDGDLASTGTDVTANNLLFTQSSGGTGPFNPFSVAVFGSRMVYLTELSSISQAYASEPNQAQQITADQHVLFLPGQRRMIAQGNLGRILYILGPNWTYSFEDTGDVPVLWPEPRLVDGNIGTLSPHGFTLDASTGTGWAAHTTGLYFFHGGAFDEHPVSHDCDPDWKRINWAYPNTVKVIDDKDNQRVYVIAPLNGNAVVNVNAAGTAVTRVSGDVFPISLPVSPSQTGVPNLDSKLTVTPAAGTGLLPQTVTITAVASETALTTMALSYGVAVTNAAALLTAVTPTHVLVFDYSEGIKKIKYSRWIIKNFSPGTGCMVQNPTSSLMELWLPQRYSPTGTSKVLRYKNDKYDTAIFNDDSLAIDMQYQTALLPRIDGRIYYHYAQQLRAIGLGALARTMYGMDSTVSQAITALTLSETPGQMYTNRYPRLRSEGASCRFTMNAANEYCRITELDHYSGKGPSRR